MKSWQGTEAAASPDFRDEELLNSPCKVLQLCGLTLCVFLSSINIQFHRRENHTATESELEARKLLFDVAPSSRDREETLSPKGKSHVFL